MSTLIPGMMMSQILILNLNRSHSHSPILNHSHNRSHNPIHSRSLNHSLSLEPSRIIFGVVAHRTRPKHQERTRTIRVESVTSTAVEMLRMRRQEAIR